LKRVDAVRREVWHGVPELANLFPHLTVLENCTLAPIWVRKYPGRRMPAAVMMKYLERVKIPHQGQQISRPDVCGGQQQCRDALLHHEPQGDAV
jgi:general L-amino acid transport system ATP-binding protein